MLLHTLIKGFLVGIAIAAPVGPIGTLCIQRSLAYGFKVGLATGVGAALADGVYGCLAGFGLTTISIFLVNHKYLIQAVGGCFLLYLSIKTIISPPTENNNSNNRVKKTNHASAFATSFGLTLSNPITILSFTAIFAGLGLGTTHLSYSNATFLILGIISGSISWWVFLSSLIVFGLRHRLNRKLMQTINIISGLTILVFAILAITSTLNHVLSLY